MVEITSKTKRVLELVKQGIPNHAVAERLGLRIQRVRSIVSIDRLRKKAAAEVEA